MFDLINEVKASNGISVIDINGSPFSVRANRKFGIFCSETLGTDAGKDEVAEYTQGNELVILPIAAEEFKGFIGKRYPGNKENTQNYLLLTGVVVSSNDPKGLLMRGLTINTLIPQQSLPEFTKAYGGYSLLKKMNPNAPAQALKISFKDKYVGKLGSTYPQKFSMVAIPDDAKDLAEGVAELEKAKKLSIVRAIDIFGSKVDPFTGLVSGVAPIEEPGAIDVASSPVINSLPPVSPTVIEEREKELDKIPF